MIDLIHKRHDGEAWQVFTELGNATGGNVSRHADAAALGLWPSRGHELHGYECKQSRGDVQKELNDPRKADAVGKFCDYWWLVVSDLKIIDGLVVPEQWGVLYPKLNVLRVHRKAPKLDAKPITRGFVAAMIRNVIKSWVPKADYNALKEKQRAELLKELERDRAWIRDDAEKRVQLLEQKIKSFESASGVEIDNWRAGDIGEAVKLVLDIRSHRGEDGLRNRITQLESQAAQERWLADQKQLAADRLRSLLEPTSGEQQDLPLPKVPRIGGLHG